MAESPAQQRRRWADVVVILVALFLIGLTAFGIPIRPQTPTNAVESLRSLYFAYGVSGALALAALFVAYRWRNVARLMLAAAAVILVFFGIDGFRESATAFWLAVVVPGLLLLVAVPFFGPMPRANP